MENTQITNIYDLPDELVQFIGTFLTSEDLDACYNVCKWWQSLFNMNKFWIKFCLYKEKYYKNQAKFYLLSQDTEKAKPENISIWRTYYEGQSTLWNNWIKKKYIKVKTGIKVFHRLMQFVTDDGISWLVSSDNKGITVWNMSESSPSTHCWLDQCDHFGINYVKDKLITFQTNYVKVFQFSKPDYEVKLLYRFIFDDDDILPDTLPIDDDYYVCSVRFIICEHFFIGYHENVCDINQTFLHIWDLNSAKKICTQSVFQQSFADYVLETTSDDITSNFAGGLILFEGDSERILVNVISDLHRICQISLFSLRETKFINVVTHIHSRTAWCSMRRNIVAIYHVLPNEDGSAISVFHVSGQFLAKLDFPFPYNPAFYGEFWFSTTRIILIVNLDVHILNVSDWKNVKQKSFKVEQKQRILVYYEPKFLLLSDSFNRLPDCEVKLNSSSSVSVKVWDIETGTVLWMLGEIPRKSFSLCQQLQEKIDYPGKMILHLHGDKDLSVLNFF